MIRVVLADDHPIVLNGLADVFRQEPSTEVVATCVSGAEALTAARQLRPDVLVVDLNMPDMSGIDVARILRKESSATKTVIISGDMRDADTVEALRTGIRGILLKEMAPQQIVECVRSVHAGGTWMESKASSRAITQLVGQDAAVRELESTLTPREVELVRLAGAGLRNKEISDRLEIGEGTVKAHLHNIYKKLGVENRVALVLFAKEKGLA